MRAATRGEVARTQTRAARRAQRPRLAPTQKACSNPHCGAERHRLHAQTQPTRSRLQRSQGADWTRRRGSRRRRLQTTGSATRQVPPRPPQPPTSQVEAARSNWPCTRARSTRQRLRTRLHCRSGRARARARGSRRRRAPASLAARAGRSRALRGPSQRACLREHAQSGRASTHRAGANATEKQRCEQEKAGREVEPKGNGMLRGGAIVEAIGHRRMIHHGDY
eukprot:5172502-Pleurochrysis_carterae.AAC.4